MLQGRGPLLPVFLDQYHLTTKNDMRHITTTAPKTIPTAAPIERPRPELDKIGDEESMGVSMDVTVIVKVIGMMIVEDLLRAVGVTNTIDVTDVMSVSMTVVTGSVGVAISVAVK